MILQVPTYSPPAGILAANFMSTDDNSSGMKGFFHAGSAGKKAALFTDDEVDIYCNKATLDTYFFHGKDVDYNAIDHFEYDQKEHTVDVVLTNGMTIDLGVKIMWLIRPYFSKAHQVYVVKTVNKKSVDGAVKPLIHK